MGFLAPFAPLIGAGIGMLGGRGGGAPKGPDTSAMQPFLDTEGEIAGRGEKRGFRDLKAADKFLRLPADFWKRILSGDRNALVELLGPEVGQIHAASDSLRNSIAQFAPRGGGLPSMLANLGTNEQGQIGNLISSIRPRAANELASVGSQIGQLGMGQLGMASGAASSALGHLTDVQRMALNQGNIRAASSANDWGGFGGVLGKTLADLFAQWGKKGGKGGTTT